MRFTAPALAALSLALATPAAANLAQGAAAPDFTTQGAVAGKVFQLHLAEQLRHGPLVLYFFPAAFTSGCNAEAHAFAEAVADFKKAGATVVGMSTDTVPVLQTFSTQQCAGKFPVASASEAVVRSYDVGLDRQHTDSNGIAHAITSRTSYVITPDGKISFVHSDMSPADHVSLTLAAVRQLQSNGPR